MPAAPESGAVRRPRWILPCLGPIPDGIEERHLRILGFVAFAMLFENYDLGVIGAALPQISGEFRLGNAEKGDFMAWIDLALSLVSLPAAVSAVFMLFLPDAHRRELEVISPAEGRKVDG